MAPGLRSKSKKYRLKGDKILTNATAYTPREHRGFLLRQAKIAYHLACIKAKNDKDLSVAARRYAETTCDLAVIYAEESSDDQALQYFEDSLEYFLSAKKAGKYTRTPDWQEDLQSTMDACVERFVTTATQHFSGAVRREAISFAMPHLPKDSPLAAQVLLELATSYFEESLLERAKGYYAKALSLLHEAKVQISLLCDLPQKTATLSDVEKNADVLAGKIKYQMYIMNALELKVRGKF